MMLFSFLDFFLEMKACFNFAFRKTWPFCFLHNWGDPGYLSGFSSAGASISVELLPPSTDTTRCSVILLKCHNWVWTPTFLRQFPVADFRKQSFNHGLVSRMIKWPVELLLYNKIRLHMTGSPHIGRTASSWVQKVIRTFLHSLISSNTRVSSSSFSLIIYNMFNHCHPSSFHGSRLVNQNDTMLCSDSIMLSLI